MKRAKGIIFRALRRPRAKFLYGLSGHAAHARAFLTDTCFHAAFILQVSFICPSFIHAHSHSLKFSQPFSPVKYNSTKG